MGRGCQRHADRNPGDSREARRGSAARMTHDARLLLYAAFAVLALIVLVARMKLHPFIALVSVSLVMGIAAGMSPLDVASAFQAGVGSALGFIAVVVGLGTMLGKLMAESGAAT